MGDATDVAVLRSAQIERADTVVSVANDDNPNIMVAQIARNLYHIPNVVCRLYDPEREVVYRELGIDTICPTVLSTREMDEVTNLRVFMTSLRRKLCANSKGEKYIQTHIGVGYRMIQITNEGPGREC